MGDCMSQTFSYLLICGIIIVSMFYVFSLVSKNTYIGFIIGYTVCFFVLVLYDNLLISAVAGTFFYTLYTSIKFVKNLNIEEFKL